ncbi:MAG TPA: efflux RND transporter periplasmic adaptor subunit [Trueperaceae bacterium]|nr:efflux RND transporter periplasmic adaptor subunit [Trueperaceae bacterium]
MATSRRARARRALGVLALSVTLALTLAACGGKKATGGAGGNQTAPAAGQTAGTSASPSSQPVDVRSVRVVTPKQGDLTAQRSASVTVDPDKSSLVAAGTSGRVARVLHNVGSTVKAGETVVQLDTTSLELQVQNAQTALASARINLAKAEKSSGEGLTQAQAALAAAQSQLDGAQKQVDSGRKLYAAGGISATDLDNLQTQLAQAKSAYQQAQNGVDQAKRGQTDDLQLQKLQVQQAQIQLDQAQHTLSEASITAPFDGVVADMRVSEGEFVGTGGTVFRLVSTGTQLAKFDVPPQDAQQLAAKGLVYVSYGGLDYAAQVIRSSEVPGSSRLVELTARLYPAKTRIPTGATAQLNYQVTLGSGQLIPADAIQTNNGESTVLLAKDGVAVQTRVDLVAEVGGQAAVQGLPDGAQVIEPVPSDLLPGAHVKVVESQGSP